MFKGQRSRVRRRLAGGISGAPGVLRYVRRALIVSPRRGDDGTNTKKPNGSAFLLVSQRRRGECKRISAFHLFRCVICKRTSSTVLSPRARRNIVANYQAGK